MITKPIATACALGAMIATSLSSAPVSQDVDPQVTGLESQVQALTEKVANLEEFVKAQAVAGKALSGALERAEAGGFTAGINPGSREALLGGLRTQAEAMQVGLDSKKEEAPKERGSMRGKRRSSR